MLALCTWQLTWLTLASHGVFLCFLQIQYCLLPHTNLIHQAQSSFVHFSSWCPPLMIDGHSLFPSRFQYCLPPAPRIKDNRLSFGSWVFNCASPLFCQSPICHNSCSPHWWLTWVTLLSHEAFLCFPSFRYNPPLVLWMTSLSSTSPTSCLRIIPREILFFPIISQHCLSNSTHYAAKYLWYPCFALQCWTFTMVHRSELSAEKTF